jgi:hypothetical protein
MLFEATEESDTTMSRHAEALSTVEGSKHELYYQTPFDRLRVTTYTTNLKFPNIFPLYRITTYKNVETGKVKRSDTTATAAVPTTRTVR